MNNLNKLTRKHFWLALSVVGVLFGALFALSAFHNKTPKYSITQIWHGANLAVRSMFYEDSSDKSFPGVDRDLIARMKEQLQIT